LHDPAFFQIVNVGAFGVENGFEIGQLFHETRYPVMTFFIFGRKEMYYQVLRSVKYYFNKAFWTL
jgi:hypothetical protein